MNRTGYKIILVDDHQLILDGLVKILSEVETLGHIITFNNGVEALEYPGLAQTDLLITDVEMPLMNGVELLKKVKQRYPSIKVLMLTMHSDPLLGREIIGLQADGYMLKTENAAEMQFAVASVLKGKKYFSQDVTMGLANFEKASKASDGTPELTQREKEILKLIAQGLSNKQIAESLFVSVKTVDTHRTNVMRKLDIHNAAGLTRYAIEQNL